MDSLEDPVPAFSVRPQGNGGWQLSYFLLPSHRHTPPPPHPSWGGHGCRNVMVSQQTDSLFPEERAAPRRPRSPSHSKHKGLSSLSARLSSSGDSLPAGESLRSDKPLGPLLAALLGLQPSFSGIGILGLTWLGA